LPRHTNFAGLAFQVIINVLWNFSFPIIVFFYLLVPLNFKKPNSIMENLNQPQSTSKTVLPNATTILVLGICSIVFSCLFVGLVLGIIGLVLGGKAKKLYKDTPAIYDGYSQVNAGYIMSIIGVCIGALYTLYYIIVALIFGAAVTSMWNMNSY
jgi:hypothetical protein